MKKYGKIFYILAAVIGVSALTIGNSNAGYGNGRNDAAQHFDSDKDGSLFPGGDCPNCGKNKNDRDGSLFPGGACKNCTKDGSLFPGTCQKCEVKQRNIRNYIPYTPIVYEAVARNCCQMAPISLSHVDFRIKRGDLNNYSEKLGNYRFRIFGCRRYDKEAMLNKGRIWEKNIDFNDVFRETVKDCYKVVDMPQDLCLRNANVELPEYVLTAEITDYFMNLCDQYDWDQAQKKNARDGSSEITVVWRLMNLTQNNIYWKGETTGYGELYEGETDGEMKLIERAFADAVSNLRNMPGFEDQLMTQVAPEQLVAEREALVEEERLLNPLKCGFRNEYETVKNCEVSRPGVDISRCRPQVSPCRPQVSPCRPTVVQSALGPDDSVRYEVVGGTGEGCAAIQEAGSCDSQNIYDPAGCSVVYEDGGVVADGGVVEIPVQEEIVESYDVISSCINEDGSIREDGNCTVVDDTWVDTGDVQSLDSFCVVDANPCNALTPETIYRMRSSVVQIESPNGRKGAGLLISDRFILTSGDLVDKTNNTYKIKTVRNDEMSARAVRINPSKNTALMMLDKSTEYTPLALNLRYPEVGHNGYMTLGMLDVKDFKDGEDYLENSARVEGYHYTTDRGAEILVNTFIQNVTVGGALFNKECMVSGMAHSGIRTNDGLDLFIPTETALRSLGINICGHEYVEESPWQQTVYKPVTQQIKQVQKAPEAMAPKDRK